MTKDDAHADIGALLYQLRDTIDRIIAVRVREHGELLEGEEAELIQIGGSLDFLLSDLRETRNKKEAQAKARFICNKISEILK